LVVRRAIIFIAVVTAWVLLSALAYAAPAPAATPEVVGFSGYAPGTIVVKTSERKLYFVLGPGRALRFPVGVGRRGKTWTGRAFIDGKYVHPAWQAPPELWGHRSGTPPIIAGGAPNNPMGEAALTLRRGEYAIHGTNNPASIGGFVSSGCIRMSNSDIRALYRLVQVGTPVVVER
jgi:lipoprotein-anchoring transpeptidase ErfK/SrfK